MSFNYNFTINPTQSNEDQEEDVEEEKITPSEVSIMITSRSRITLNKSNAQPIEYKIKAQFGVSEMHRIIIIIWGRRRLTINKVTTPTCCLGVSLIVMMMIVIMIMIRKSVVKVQITILMLTNFQKRRWVI